MQRIDLKNFPILFVDDEEMALVGFADQYEGEYTIHTAKNGREALEVLRAHPEIALIVADQRMPEMTGVELFRHAMEVVPDAVRILVTAYTDLDAVVEAINTGNVYRYVSKPWNEDDLRQCLRQGIERYFLVRERDRLYSEKIESLKKAARTHRLTAIGILAAGMAHEINNPLVAISSFLQVLPEKLRGLVPDEKRAHWEKDYWEDLYQISVTEADRIRLLIGRLLNYSKTMEQDELNLKEAALNPMIEEAAAFLTPEAMSRGNRVELSLAPNLPMAKMDPDRIHQLLSHLILNAVQATQNGCITVKTGIFRDHQGRELLELTVADTGAGISEENLQNLFNPFFTTKEADGTGLGLMACHNIVDEHRGTIDLRSELGKGTTVTVRLPLNPPKHERRTKDRRLS